MLLFNPSPPVPFRSICSLSVDAPSRKLDVSISTVHASNSLPYLTSTTVSARETKTHHRHYCCLLCLFRQHHLRRAGALRQSHLHGAQECVQRLEVAQTRISIESDRHHWNQCVHRLVELSRGIDLVDDGRAVSINVQYISADTLRTAESQAVVPPFGESLRFIYASHEKKHFHLKKINSTLLAIVLDQANRWCRDVR